MLSSSELLLNDEDRVDLLARKVKRREATVVLLVHVLASVDQFGYLLHYQLGERRPYDEFRGQSASSSTFLHSDSPLAECTRVE